MQYTRLYNGINSFSVCYVSLVHTSAILFYTPASSQYLSCITEYNAMLKSSRGKHYIYANQVELALKYPTLTHIFLFLIYIVSLCMPARKYPTRTEPNKKQKPIEFGFLTLSSIHVTPYTVIIQLASSPAPISNPRAVHGNHATETLSPTTSVREALRASTSRQNHDAEGCDKMLRGDGRLGISQKVLSSPQPQYLM